MLVLLLFTGCSDQAKLQRAERKIEKLVKRYPELLQVDTAKVLDTTYVPGVDTFFVQQFADGDTITFFDTITQTTVKTVVTNDTIYQSVKSPADTIVKTIRVPYEKLVVKEQSLLFWERAALFAGKYFLLPFLIVILVLFFYRKLA